jgi:DnaJ-class molecular chaperone
MACFYKILGVSTQASQEEIRRAFRLLALRWHPDRNPDHPGAARRFQEAFAAYETLMDPIKRRRYDRANGYRKKDRQRHSNWGPEDVAQPSIEELLREMFGITPVPWREGRVCDLRFDIQVPHRLLDAGTMEHIQYERRVLCKECSGGVRKGRADRCESCGGSGEAFESCALDVWIPAGSEEGKRIRIPGMGDLTGGNKCPGDLVVLVHVI